MVLTLDRRSRLLLLLLLLFGIHARRLLLEQLAERVLDSVATAT